jgi:AcrR family transcriptional regulator
VATPETEPNPTQIRMLEAAFRLWEQEPPSALFGGLSVSRVAKVAGVTRATFYSYWPTIDDYLADLLDHLPERDPDGYRPEADAAMRQLGAATVQITPDMFEAAERQLVAMTEDPAFRVRLGFISKSDDPGVAAKLRERYRLIDDRKAGISAAIREGWGREIRPPLTPKQTQAVFTAFTEGYAMRRLISPDTVPVAIYGKVLLSLLMLLTRRIDDPRTLDDVLDTTNSWPAVGMRLRNAAASTRPPTVGNSLDAATTHHVVQQARRLQASMSWHELTLGDIAHVTGVSEEVLIRGFGSKAGLAMAIFMMNVHERYDALEPTGDAATDLRNMIAAGAAELQRAPGLTQNVLQVLGGSTLPVVDLIDWNPILMLAEQIRQAQGLGLLRDDVDPQELALTINQLQLMEVDNTSRAAAGSANMIELLLAGAGLEPSEKATPAPSYMPSWVDDEPRPDPFLS